MRTMIADQPLSPRSPSFPRDGESIEARLDRIEAAIARLQALLEPPAEVGEMIRKAVALLDQPD